MFKIFNKSQISRDQLKETKNSEAQENCKTICSQTWMLRFISFTQMELSMQKINITVSEKTKCDMEKQSGCELMRRIKSKITHNNSKILNDVLLKCPVKD